MKTCANGNSSNALTYLKYCSCWRVERKSCVVALAGIARCKKRQLKFTICATSSSAVYDDNPHARSDAFVALCSQVRTTPKVKQTCLQQTTEIPPTSEALFSQDNTLLKLKHEKLFSEQLFLINSLYLGHSHRKVQTLIRIWTTVWSPPLKIPEVGREQPFKPAMSNRNCLLSQTSCPYLNQGHTLNDLLSA